MSNQIIVHVFKLEVIYSNQILKSSLYTFLIEIFCIAIWNKIEEIFGRLLCSFVDLCAGYITGSPCHSESIISKLHNIKNFFLTRPHSLLGEDELVAFHYNRGLTLSPIRCVLLKLLSQPDQSNESSMIYYINLLPELHFHCLKNCFCYPCPISIFFRNDHLRSGCICSFTQDKSNVQSLQEFIIILLRGLCIVS